MPPAGRFARLALMTPRARDVEIHEALDLLDQTLVCNDRKECCWLGDPYYDEGNCYASAELLQVLLHKHGARLVGWDEGENSSQRIFDPGENVGHTFVEMPDGTVVDRWLAREQPKLRCPPIVRPGTRCRSLYGKSVGPVVNWTSKHKLAAETQPERRLRELLLERRRCREK